MRRRSEGALKVLLLFLLLVSSVSTTVGCKIPKSPVTGGPCPLITGMIAADPGGAVARIFADDPLVAQTSSALGASSKALPEGLPGGG